MGAKLLVQTIPDYIAGSLHVRPQPSEGASYARKITKEDGHLDWAQPASTLWCRVRGLTPWPGAYTHLPAQPNPKLLKIWQAELASNSQSVPGTVLAADKSGVLVACGQGGLRITELQLEGKRRMSAQEFLTGHPLEVGSSLK
jgi:methionyl-tRNA formyltransferase